MPWALAVGVLASFLGKDTSFAPRPGPFIALGLAGFAIGVVGHIVRARMLVAVGIAIAFGAIMLVPLVVYLAGR